MRVSNFSVLNTSNEISKILSCLKDMKYGIEVEFLIFSQDEKNQFGKGQYIEFINLLEKQKDFKVSSVEDVTTLSIESINGYLKIKPDFSFNILEVAFPPYDINDFESFRKDFESILNCIDNCLAQLGFKRFIGEYKSQKEENIEVIAADRFIQHREILSGRSFGDYYSSIFPSFCAATQVHLSIPPSIYYNILPYLYQFELLFIETYNLNTENSKLGVNVDARSLCYEHSLGPNYPLKTIPLKIPSSDQELLNYNNSGEILFPNESNPDVFDKSYIRSRPFGTIEFRSVGSLSCPFKIRELVKQRIVQLVASIREEEIEAQKLTNCRGYFEKIILGQDYDQQVKRRLLNELLESAILLEELTADKQFVSAVRNFSI